MTPLLFNIAEISLTDGIVKGTSETTFSPDANVTRQEAATFIFRYAEYKGYDTKARIDISTFPDNKSIQNFAKDAVSWANATRIITDASHSGKVVLDPRGIATRAQIATILMRFCEIYGTVGTEK